MKRNIGKISLFVKGIFIYIKYKLVYLDKVQMYMINSIKGELQIKLSEKSRIEIGRFLMSEGPLYIKCGYGSSLKIGDRCFFNHNCAITCHGSMILGDDCIFANNLVIVDHDHLVEDGRAQGNIFEKKDIKIGNNVWCGANVTILKGVTIGNGAVIAAGAVVNRSIPSHELWGGVPAKKIKNLE